MVTTTREGTNVFQTLQAALAQSRQEVGRIEADAGQVDARVNDLIAQRGQALMELARHYLPAMTRPTIEQTFEGVRADLLAILARRDQRQRALQQQLADRETEARRLDASIEEVTAKLNEKVAQRESLEARVAEILKGHDDFQARSKLALQAEEQLHRNEQRVAEIEAEAAEKRPAFEKSRLFRYLYDRKFGTPEYAGTGLILKLDRWVARLIEFGRARVGYEYLINTPPLVAAEVSRRRDQFNELMTQVEAIQHAEAEKIGLNAVLKEGDALGSQRDQLVQDLDAVHHARQSLQNELGELAQARDQFYGEALTRFQAFLSQTELAVLDRRARQTPEPEDDSIVGQITQLTRQILDLQASHHDLSERHNMAESQAQGLEALVREYRHAEYDSQRSYFTDGFDPDQALALYQAGQVDAHGLWQMFQQAHRLRPHWVEQSANTTVDVINSPTSRVLIGALGQVLNGALQEAAYRGVQRRAEMPYFPPAPSPPSYSPPSYSPPSFGGGGGGGGGFTSGEGF